MIAALYVENGGAYWGLEDVDPWDQARDARIYAGPWPVVAHPPCQRWGRYWHGSPRKPHQYEKGADGGCFAAALGAVRTWGGVLEHPKDSHAWEHFGLVKPPRAGGWVRADAAGGWTCCVDQGHYGHFSRKATWLYAVGIERPELRWARASSACRSGWWIATGTRRPGGSASWPWWAGRTRRASARRRRWSSATCCWPWLGA